MSETKEKVYLFHIHQYGYGEDVEEAWEDAKSAIDMYPPEFEDVEFEEVVKEDEDE